MNNEVEKVIEDYIANTTETVVFNNKIVEGTEKVECLRQHWRIISLKKYEISLRDNKGKILKNKLVINGKECKVNLPALLRGSNGECIENLEQYYNRTKTIAKQEYEKYFPSLRKIKFKNKEISIQEVDNKKRYIKWDDIEFVNNKLHVTLNNTTNSINWSGSTTEHETLKKILFRKSQEGLLIDTSQKPFKIIDTEILDTLISFLTLQIKLTNKEISIPEYIRQSSSFSSLNGILRKVLPKNEFIDFLIENHNINYPVVPVIELNNKNEEPSYIFTMKKGNSLLLIWENKSTGRATYLFRSDESQYKKTLQTLYDFIRSELERKRSGIEEYEKQLIEMGLELNFSKKIIHDDFDNWQTNILY